MSMVVVTVGGGRKQSTMFPNCGLIRTRLANIVCVASSLQSGKTRDWVNEMCGMGALQ